MKKLIHLSILAAATLPVSAAVIFVDLGSLAIPSDSDGISINILTGDTVVGLPDDFNDAPWINFFHGGIEIATSELLRPWATASADYNIESDYFINVAPGTVVDSSGTFVTGETGSFFHMGFGANQFQSGSQGYLAFEYQATSLSGTSYGWLSFTPSESGPGVSVSLAYSDTPGETIAVGAIPEPATVAGAVGALGLLFAGSRRRRRA